MSWLSDLFGGGEDTKTQTTVPQWYQQPEYPQSEAARGNWWDTLQNWQSSGTYGANLPDYDKIYANAANRINQYYWGGASSPGLIDKIRAGAARRGVAESPATDVLTQRMGVEQAGQLRDTSVGVDTQKAAAIEAARNNWMTSLMNLSQQKPSGTWGGTVTQTQPTESLLPSLISSGVSLYGQGQTNKMYSDWLNKIYGTNQQGTTTQGSLTNPYGENYSDLTNLKTGLDTAAMVPGPQQPYVAGADALWNLYNMFSK